jgi:hypothetical protein
MLSVIQTIVKKTKEMRWTGFYGNKKEWLKV